MEHFDVVIIGAGLSGIGAAHHLKTRCPNKSFVLLEGRERLGGTWDLFRYPGIRSDSDMHTLGYSFRPWTEPKAIADGPSILAYVRDTARADGTDAKIHYGHRVVRARWSSDAARWTIEARDASGGARVITCSFVYSCTGYYDYDAGYTPDFPGRDRFRGRVVHPQQWTDDVDYAGKRVVVIGSGATAVTLVPELAKKAASVVMLQRSPTYIVSLPDRDRVADWMRARLPAGAAYAAARWKNVLFGMAFYAYCRRYPDHAKRFLVGQAARQLGGVDVATHFTPSYKPWDQRLCLVPNGDLFKAVKRGRAEVVTDHVDTFTEKGIRLRSGRELEADLVVTATGLKLKFLGGIDVEVDGARPDFPRTLVYKGMMAAEVPNLAWAIGYTNASWTLKCDLTSEYVCRLLRYMDARGLRQVRPRLRDPRVREVPLLDFTSGYVQRAVDALPKQGSRAPWRLRQNYALDRASLRYAPIADGSLEFSP